MNRSLKIAAKFLIALVSSLALLLTLIVTVFFCRPDWLVNKKSLKIATKVVGHYNVNITWDDLTWVTAKPSTWTHHFTWDFSNLCIDVPDIPFHFCSKTFSGQIALAWNVDDLTHFLRLDKFGRWNLRGGDLAVGPFAQSSSEEQSTFDINKIRLPWFLEHATLDSSTLSFDRIAVALSSGTLEGALALTFSQTQAEAPLDPAIGKLLIVSAKTAPNHAAPLCWSSSKEHCLEEASATVALGASSDFVRVVQIGPVKVLADRLNIALKSESSTTSKSLTASRNESTDGTYEMPEMISGALLSDLDIGITRSSFALNIADRIWKFAGDLNVHTTGSRHSNLLADVGIALKLRNFCATTPYLEGCFPTVDLEAVAGKDTGDGSIQIKAIQRAVAKTNHLDILIPEDDESIAPTPKREKEKAPTEKQSKFDWQSIPFENKDRNHYLVQIKRFAIIPTTKTGVRKKAKASGSASLELTKMTELRSSWQLITNIKPTLSDTARSHSATPTSPKEADIIERQSVVTGSLRVDSGQLPLSGPYRAFLKADASFSTGERFTLRIAGQQSNDKNKLIGGTLNAQADFLDENTINLQLSGQQKDVETLAINGLVRASSILGTTSQGVTISALIDRKKTTLNMNGTIAVRPKLARIVLPNVTDPTLCHQTPPPGPNLDLSAISFKSCTLVLNYADGLPHSQLNFNCPVNLAATLTSPEAESHRESRKISLDVATKIYGKGKDDPQARGGLSWNGGVKLDLMHYDLAINKTWLDLTSRMTATFKTSQANPAHDLSWQTAGDFDLRIKRFADLVTLLERLPYAVPAPFNVLNGVAKLHAAFSGDSQKDRVLIPFTVATDLRSNNQVVNANAEGLLSLFKIRSKEPQTSLDTKAVFQNVALTMPQFTLTEKFPMLFPDKRIEVEECQNPSKDKPASKENATYRIAINTPPGHPVQISTNLAKDQVPIALENIVLDSSGVTGHVKVTRFGVEVFRRQADVKSFEVSMIPNQDSPAIEGNIEFKYTDITINLLIHGTADEPLFAFESTPIRSEREIITILLYGQDATSFNDDQLQTADDLSAAFADQMIGLASLFMLAKTPVESVRYNPATKTFNAKVRLGEETSLNIGTSAEADQRVGVRHRLNSTWSVESDVSKDEATDTTSGTALLEWSKRF